MIYSNNFEGKKAMTSDLAKVYKNMKYYDIADIELKRYVSKKEGYAVEFVVLTWINGVISTANNNMNSLSATARNIARMLDGGVYDNYEWYLEIMGSDKWEEV